MLPQNASLEISLFLPGYSDVFGYSYVTSAEPLRYQSADFLTHTHSIFSQLQLCRCLRLRRRDAARLWVGVWAHTQTPSQAAGVCVCVRAGFGLGFAVSCCLADGHWAHREGGAGAPTSRLGQRVNTHTIQRCCMRNQCEFGKLHNINLF